MEGETLQETFDKYMKGKIESKEKKLEMTLKSKIPELKAKVIKKSYNELVKAGFSAKDAMIILTSGMIEI